jgi:two-component system sensor histidine kinase and response regulator WspE
MLTVRVEDDGRGIDPESIRRKVVERGLADESLVANLSDAELFEFLFLPGFSTARDVTEVSGRGVGLDVVQSMVQDVSGVVRIESMPGRGTTFTFQLPVTLSVIRAALTEIGGEIYAFPLSRLERLISVDRQALEPVEGRLQFTMDGESTGLMSASAILGFGESMPDSDEINVLVIGQSGKMCGLIVDAFIGEQDLVVRPLDERLGRVPHLSAAAVLEDGEPILILDVEDILQSVQQQLGEGRLRGVRSLERDAATRDRRRILVVDDSITVREVERQLLTRHGYEVDVAVDGRDGWTALSSGSYDLLITDVDMPRMNGIELIRVVRADDRFANLPIVIVSYKGREEDRMLGLEVGANAYLTKGSFHDESLITTVSDLIGGSA